MPRAFDERWCAEFAKQCCESMGVVRNSVKDYRNKLKVWMRWIGGGEDQFAAATREDALMWLESMSGYANSTQRRFVQSLSMFYRFAAQEGLCATDIFSGLSSRIPSPQPMLYEPISAAELRKVLDTTSARATNLSGCITDAAMKMKIRCGIDFTEMERATIGDLRLGESSGYFKSCKCGRGGGITQLDSETVNALRGYLKYRPDAVDSEPLFTPTRKSPSGRNYLDGGALSARCSRVFCELGFKIGPKSLSGSMLRLAAQEGATTEEVHILSRNLSQKCAIKLLKTSEQAEYERTWDSFRSAIDSSAPVVKAEVSVAEVEKALESGAERFNVVVWPDGTTRLIPMN